MATPAAAAPCLAELMDASIRACLKRTDDAMRLGEADDADAASAKRQCRQQETTVTTTVTIQTTVTIKPAVTTPPPADDDSALVELFAAFVAREYGDDAVAQLRADLAARAQAKAAAAEPVAEASAKPDAAERKRLADERKRAAEERRAAKSSTGVPMPARVRVSDVPRVVIATEADLDALSTEATAMAQDAKWGLAADIRMCLPAFHDQLYDASRKSAADAAFDFTAVPSHHWQDLARVLHKARIYNAREQRIRATLAALDAALAECDMRIASGKGGSTAGTPRLGDMVQVRARRRSVVRRRATPACPGLRQN